MTGTSNKMSETGRQIILEIFYSSWENSKSISNGPLAGITQVALRINEKVFSVPFFQNMSWEFWFCNTIEICVCLEIGVSVSHSFDFYCCSSLLFLDTSNYGFLMAHDRDVVYFFNNIGTL